MNIRKANNADLDRILEIYEYARSFMISSGNPTQWGSTYPEKEMLEEDISLGNLYVMEEEEIIHGVFVFIIGEDSTYQVIAEGQWLNDEVYGTIHRIAGDGKVRGILEECLTFCKKKIRNIRIDTHDNNKVMQHLIEKNGFKKCGIIFAYDGSPRIAYHLIVE